MALPPSSSQPVGRPLVSSPAPISSTLATQVQDPETGNPARSSHHNGGNTSLATRTLCRFLGLMTPYEQMDYLRQKRHAKRWELFRDGLIRTWSNLNIIARLFFFCRTPSRGLIAHLYQCGLIMGYLNPNYPRPERKDDLAIIEPSRRSYLETMYCPVRRLRWESYLSLAVSLRSALVSDSATS